ncbi:WD40-repeat-containing domain protein [Pavlovales sp. CCMP2436]|nr:WD40-repeat-containing domain protein [Pavlovales sp. CCMP2436]
MTAEEEVATLAADYFYDVGELRQPVNTDAELAADSLELYHSFAFESGRRYNVHVLDETTLIFAAGNVVHLFDIATGQQIYLHGLDGRGIGAVAVHPSRKYFAVGEKGDAPNIYVYAYPSLKLYRVLRKGTEQAYTALAFTATGGTLASVGAYPDYMLTVWDWQNELVILRNKAFSQEVYSVAFAPTSDEVLITSGMGHIRFWRMASTFTGLKLQGDIGKFGNVELTDVCAYAELPGGKVLSGTEGGRMLLWDGNLIEFEISRRGGAPCHKGNIEVLRLEGGTLTSAGHDGFVSEETPVFELEPLTEKRVGGEDPTMIGNSSLMYTNQAKEANKSQYTNAV